MNYTIKRTFTKYDFTLADEIIDYLTPTIQISAKSLKVKLERTFASFWLQLILTHYGPLTHIWLGNFVFNSRVKARPSCIFQPVEIALLWRVRPKCIQILVTSSAPNELNHCGLVRHTRGSKNLKRNFPHYKPIWGLWLAVEPASSQVHFLAAGGWLCSLG